MSNEPSMEHILSSIKRIIAEDGEAAVAERRDRKPARTPLPRSRTEGDDDILELSEPMAETAEPFEDAFAGAPADAAPSDTVEVSRAELVSPDAAAASKTALDTLSRLVVRPEVTGSDTLEGIVREMLRPMLAEWLDANLPQVVDAMVAREIARITGR